MWLPIGIYRMGVGLLLGVCTYSSEKGVEECSLVMLGEKLQEWKMHKVPLRLWMPKQDFTIPTWFRDIQSALFESPKKVKAVKFQAEFSSIVCSFL